MENTGISKEIKEFVPRKSKEEFFQDGEIIKELFEWTRNTIKRVEKIISDEFTLRVFNLAYRICWMVVNERATIKQIEDLIEPINQIDRFRNHSLAVAYTLFRLNKEYSLRESDIFFSIVRVLLPPSFYAKHYSAFVRENSLPHPISFRAPLSESEHEVEIDFGKTKSHIVAAIDKAIRLESENKELHKLIEEERIKRKTAELRIEEKQTKLNCLENDAFYKAVNINSILKYAQDQGNCDNNDIKIIRMMLLALCANKVPNDVIEAIKTLKLGGNITIGEQHNHGCQQFYGNITDSEFPSK